MYDPTFTHHITMTVYAGRLQLAADARTRPGAATRALRALLGRAVPRSARRSTTAPASAMASCTL